MLPFVVSFFHVICSCHIPIAILYSHFLSICFHSLFLFFTLFVLVIFPLLFCIHTFYRYMFPFVVSFFHVICSCHIPISILYSHFLSIYVSIRCFPFSRYLFCHIYISILYSHFLSINITFMIPHNQYVYNSTSELRDPPVRNNRNVLKPPNNQWLAGYETTR